MSRQGMQLACMIIGPVRTDTWQRHACEALAVPSCSGAADAGKASAACIAAPSITARAGLTSTAGGL